MTSKKALFFLLMQFCFCGLYVFGQAPNRVNQTSAPGAYRETLEQAIFRHARNYNLDGRLLQALIYRESTFKIKAVSYKGAACYTQLMPGTARRFGLIVSGQIDERFNAEKCLDAGARYLALLMRMFRGDVRLALAGYNAGEGAVLKFGGRVPPYRETVLYVEAICRMYYGQSGHGVAMAYNQPLAEAWTSGGAGSYRNVINTASMRQVYPVGASQISPQAAAQTIDPKFAAKPAEIKKPVVSRVSITQTEPRIRTESLSFGSWEK